MANRALTAASELRSARRGAAPSPFEFGREGRGADYVRLARRIISVGWRMTGRERITLIPPVAWGAPPGADRTWRYELQAWGFMRPLIVAFEVTGEERFLTFALALAEDWIARGAGDDQPFAWYDAAVGVRAQYLAYLVDLAARRDEVDDSRLVTLAASAAEHAERLAEDGFFAAHSNHGVQQALGQLVLARRLGDVPACAAGAASGRARLVALFERQFTVEGVHREHSPSYHLIVLELFEAARTAGLLPDRLQDRRRVVAEALAWFVLPGGRWPLIGDTAAPDIVVRRRFDDVATLRHALTDGREGAAPAGVWRAFAASGWYASRSWDVPGDEQWALVLAAAFHGPTHKHADDLAVVWMARGVDILTDGGRFSYDYDDPRRRHLSSAAAHSTVEVDGAFPAGGDGRPYGSGLTGAGELAGVLYAEGVVEHAGCVRHRRVVLHRPGAWLVLVDELDGLDGAEHRFVSRLHFAPELERTDAEDGGVRLRHTAAGVVVQARSLLHAPAPGLVRGRDEPMLGWASRAVNAIEPRWTAEWAYEPAERRAMATLLWLGDGRVEVDAAADLRDGAGTLGWRADGRRHVMTLGARGTRPLTGYVVDGDGG